MSLFESVLSAVLVAVFMPLIFALTRDANLLRREAEAMKAELVRDAFISESFEVASPNWGAQVQDGNVDVASAVESWKAVCSSLYPQIQIKTSALAFKDGEVLFECAWEGYRRLSIKK